MATVAQAYGNVRIYFSTSKNENFPHVRDFDRVTVLRNNPDGSGLQYLVQEFDSLRSKVTVTVNGPANIYGVLLDQKTGVSMDNVPMRGSSGNIFTRITRNTIEPFFRHENVRLIILQYGGNSVPGLRTEKSLHDFCKEIQRQIRFFQQLAPEAKILYIGPSDMSTRIGGEMRTYTLLPRFVELLDQYVTECGASFWNLFEAMGGTGSMVRWVAARPQLAGEDYIHFTHKGAERVSDLLYETIDTYYNNYKLRHGNFTLELPTANEDSLINDTIDDYPVLLH
jgi:lysophospholipase L1-like esterase